MDGKKRLGTKIKKKLPLTQNNCLFVLMLSPSRFLLNLDVAATNGFRFSLFVSLTTVLLILLFDAHKIEKNEIKKRTYIC